MLPKHIHHDVLGRIGRQHLAQEVVGLGRHDAEEADGAQLSLEVGALADELRACLPVVGSMLVVDLHEELGKGIHVPYGHLFLDSRDELHIGRGEDAQSQSRHAVALGDTLHDCHAGVCLQDVVREQRVGLKVFTEVNEALVDHQPDAALPAPGS